MQQSPPTISPEELHSSLFGTKENLTNFQNLKSTFGTNATIKPIPLSYSFEYNQNMEYQSKVLLELIRLHKQKKLDVQKSIGYVSDFTAYASPLELHFGIFYHLAKYFSTDPKLAEELVSNVDLFGGVLLHEIDFTNNFINDNIRTTAYYDPKTQDIVLNSLKDSAKYCQYFNVYGTHAIVFCRLYNNTDFIGHYPFLLRLRDPATGEFVKGLEMKWLGPSLGNRGGREHFLTFTNVRIPLKQHLFNRFLRYDNSGISMSTVETRLQLLIQTALMQQKLLESHRATRELSKAVYLVTKYTNMRTQFKTLPEKGQERKIFDYQFNKFRILKGLVNSIVFQIGLNACQERVDSLVSSPETNADQLVEFTHFTNALYPYIHERAAEGVESLREGTGGMGYLKFSGIPTTQENVINASVAACPGKEERYIEIALVLLNSDLTRKSAFMSYVAPDWTDNTTVPNSKDENYYTKIENLLALLKIKLSKRRATLQKAKSAKALVISADEMKENKLFYEEAIKLGKDFLDYTLVSFAHSELSKNVNKEKNSVLGLVLKNFVLQNLIDDSRPILEDSGLVPIDFYVNLKDTQANNVAAIGTIAEKITQAYGFDTEILNSAFQTTAEETYKKLLDLAKHQNLRNDPKLHAEIRKDLLEYMNRPRPKL
mmetsp:Transcript_49757/g.57313  ORF Transcript_49757/g.57313 Transcript_49757/m.57313 type:complete len:657 (+) Transcript_49757:35-2005(+)